MGRFLLVVVGGRGPDIRAQLRQGDSALALYVELANEPTIEALAFAQGLAQVADGSAGTLGVFRLVSRAQGRKVGAKGVHALEITIW